MRPIVTAAAVLALLAPALAAPALAQDAMPKFYIYGETDDDTELTTCKVSHQSAITAVQAELRGAGIVIQTDSKDPEAVMDGYINITALPLPNSNTGCAYNFELTLESFNDVANPFSGTEEFTKLAYCTKGTLMISEKATAQTSINAKLRSMMQECLTKYRGRNKS